MDQSELAVAAVCTHFLPGSPGHVIVVPVRHYENLPVRCPRANSTPAAMPRPWPGMKDRYGAAGITLRQKTTSPRAARPCFHFHLHVVPRYRGGRL